MSFIQCASAEEAEALMATKKSGFVSSDFRVYDEIDFWDDGAIYDIPATTLLRLFELQLGIECVQDGRNEMSFSDIAERAKELSEMFERAAAAIKAKPISKEMIGQSDARS